MHHSDLQIKVLATGSSGNAIIISDGASPLLLEAGLVYKQLLKLSNFDLPRHCLITHEHQDHAKGVKELLRVGMDCYMSKGTAEALGLAERHNLHIVEQLKDFEIGDWRIKPFLTKHDAAEPMGFLLRNGDDKILFVLDTAYIPYSFNNLTYILIECNWSQEMIIQNFDEINTTVIKRIVKTHMSLERVIEFLQRTDLDKIKAIYLLHASGKNSDINMFKRTVEEATGRVVYV